jgi:hypothetical protein
MHYFIITARVGTFLSNNGCVDSSLEQMGIYYLHGDGIFPRFTLLPPNFIGIFLKDNYSGVALRDRQTLHL